MFLTNNATFKNRILKDIKGPGMIVGSQRFQLMLPQERVPNFL